MDYSIRIGYWYSKSFWYLIVIVTCDKFSHENVGKRIEGHSRYWYHIGSGDELKQFVNDERMRMDKEKEQEGQRKEKEKEAEIERKQK